MGKSKKKGLGKATGAESIACTNRRAAKEYEFEDRIEAGMVLKGSEVKSLRQSRASLEGAYATVDADALMLHQMHIAPYEQAGPFQHESKRVRKLLVHRRELERLRGLVSQRGYTLIPLRVYFKGGRAKVEIGLGRGRRHEDRREDLKRKAEMVEARDAMRRAKG